ncbi:hypothetical protein [Streptomyces sp. NBC_01601]|uniref:hypothetical protein n=1 Tax=Streptomyces sp. NBC_01601 TaxID=2975892 RepID=UPI002E2829AF|nr:hypothetical protein [Streptomyces sp. NBC_01601]
MTTTLDTLTADPDAPRQLEFVEVVGLHAADGSACPLTGDTRHERRSDGRPLNLRCAALGGRQGFGISCLGCHQVFRSGSKLAAIEHKARHLALHRGDLLVTRTVRDSEGPLVIHELQTLRR